MTWLGCFSSIIDSTVMYSFVTVLHCSEYVAYVLLLDTAFITGSIPSMLPSLASSQTTKKNINISVIYGN